MSQQHCMRAVESYSSLWRLSAGIVAIANINSVIIRTNETKYVVKSQNGNGDYDISLTDLGWICSCPDDKFRGVKCKHIFAVEINDYIHQYRFLYFF
ncbi:MAG: SWIM zinc finger family protein [Candidatus Nitrosopolaris sp.]